MKLIQALRAAALLVVVAGCGDDDPNGTSGAGASDDPGSGGSGGSDTSSTSSQGGGASSSSSGSPGQGACQESSCGTDQICTTCVYALGPGYVCADDEPVTEGRFDCSATTCEVGAQACTTTRPQMDGCPQASCETIPEACADDVTCECFLEQDESAGATCTTDDDGNLLIGRLSGPP